jgi:hypothetical protein
MREERTIATDASITSPLLASAAAADCTALDDTVTASLLTIMTSTVD